jgi:hypothetical protein
MNKLSHSVSSLSDSPTAPRYLRFVTALLLGAAVSSAPFAAGCGDDAPSADAAPIDAGVEVVDGPLAPPDLPHALA